MWREVLYDPWQEGGREDGEVCREMGYSSHPRHHPRHHPRPAPSPCFFNSLCEDIMNDWNMGVDQDVKDRRVST